MATFETAAPRAGKNPRARKHNFRLDMTRMVDLAFLLLSFFIVQAVVGRPAILQLTMPQRPVAGDERGCICNHSIATILLGSRHQLYYYFGLNTPTDPSMPKPEVRRTSFSPVGIRRVLLSLRQKQPGFIIDIKPGSGATYRDLVDILDEMNITDQRRYVLTDLTAADRQLLPATARE